jgi:hypothetical protein
LANAGPESAAAASNANVATNDFLYIATSHFVNLKRAADGETKERLTAQGGHE